MKELIARFNAKTPVFFKTIRNLSLAIAGACGTAAVTYSQLPAGIIELVPVSLVKTIAIAAIVAASVAQLTKQ